MEIKTLFFLFPLLWMATPTKGQAPLDVGSIELLISKHKKQYDLLKERNTNETKHTSVTTLVKDISTKYQKLHQELNKQYALLSSWVDLGINALNVMEELKKTSVAIPPFLANANKIKNIAVLEKYIRAGKEIQAEIKLCAKISASIPALRMNPKELHELSNLIIMRLYYMRYIIERYTGLINGQISLDLFQRPKISDRLKIARKIINDFNKENAE